MTEQIDLLYIGTSVMVFLASCLIFFVVWATTQIKQQRIYTEQRDKHWISRIEAVELLVKSEFHQILTILKDKF